MKLHKNRHRRPVGAGICKQLARRWLGPSKVLIRQALLKTLVMVQPSTEDIHLYARHHLREAQRCKSVQKVDPEIHRQVEGLMQVICVKGCTMIGKAAQLRASKVLRAKRVTSHIFTSGWLRSFFL